MPHDHAAPAIANVPLARSRDSDFVDDVGHGLGSFICAQANTAERTGLPFAPAAEGLFLADLHADTLLWGVDPWRRRSGGHLDIPRLVEAGIGLQVFGGPTWTPLPRGVEGNGGCGDCVSAESLDQASVLFPAELWTSLWRDQKTRRRDRAMRLAARFRRMIEAAPNGGARLVPVLSACDVDRLAARRPADPARPEIGVMLSLEGLHWLDATSDRAAVAAEIAALKAEGFRMIAPTHRFSNGLGGASEDPEQGTGLSAAGRHVIEACFDQGVAVDMAHASSAVIQEASALSLARADGVKPLVVSHGGLRATHPKPRNLDTEDLHAVVRTGGLIGIGFWRSAMGFTAEDPWDVKLAAIVRAFATALGLLSEEGFADEMRQRFGRYDPYEHLAFGSDFDGAVYAPFDISGVSHVVAALAEVRGEGGRPLFPRDKLKLVAGENTLNTLRRALAA